MSEQPVGIVTGASGGIGTAVARKLSAKGYHLALMSRSGCREIAEELGALGVAGSVLDDNDVQNLVDQTMQRFGRVDGVVYGAGRHAQI
ncbi:MAG: SDR family NAD(P)-dependent oxidoreductase, partial [Alphaproteobacteria bacterium]